MKPGQDKKPEEVEGEFDTFFENLGYKRVSDDVGHSPNFSNADYINMIDQTIVELKVLTKDFFPEGGVIDSLNAFIVQPKDPDKLGPKGQGQYTMKLPKLNREGKHDEFEEPLRRTLRKAGKQLRETSQYYFHDQRARKFVFLAQVGLTSLSPLITAKLVQKLRNEGLKSLDGVVICNPYFHGIDPTTQQENSVCISVTNELSPDLKRRCMGLADAWIKFLESGGHNLTSV